jgi:hypothetical protein
MGLLPLEWVVVDSPARLLSSRMNGSAARVLWVSQDGWVALTFANGFEAGNKWEIQAENLRQFCPLDEDGYWAALWDERFSIKREVAAIHSFSSRGALIIENPSQQFQPISARIPSL